MPERPLEPADSSSLCPHCQTPRLIVVPAAGSRQTVWWVLAVLLAVIATHLVSRHDAVWSQSAMAQVGGSAGMPGAGARGIYAFTGQLGAKEYGLFMMDVDSGTIWCYQMGRSRDGDLQLQLVAARSWIFDRFLEEFNVAKPTPHEVQLMVRQQRGNAAAAGDAGPLNVPLPLPAAPSTVPEDQPAFTPALPN
ncbi:MAG TPA: hypothetical protein PL151_06980 [Phycisphaerae bacterium]|nr:hypothetical protein [Phycisphaerae bacterium]HOJ73732.1 hypothetical protein [Phycisphaerae bacterium]HOM50379.1 hypothetical protein [Phycisphaerae bacterium]HON66295.1 hypothetical protein [Phycisphaerae bacterium]HOQ84209.1 hypothetical protein [Phycisphaerae bacterium]